MPEQSLTVGDTAPSLDFPGLTIAELAVAARVNERTIRRAISEGRLPAYRFGKLIRIRHEDAAVLFERMSSEAS